MKKSIFLFFAAILCAMTANAAYNQQAKDLYFDNSEAKWEKCYVYIGHSTWTSVYPLTRVSGTQYLWKLAKADFNSGNSWNGADGWVLCYEKWWDSKAETIDKYTWHGDKNVTQKSTSAWVDTKIYKTNGTASTKSDNHTINAYKVTSYTKSNYTVTINTVEGGTLTVKDYDNNAVATGASKIHLTVLKFSAAPASGYVFEGVQINNGSTTTTISASEINTKTHTLTSNVTITPVWKATTSTVTVTANATNGTVTGAGVYEEGTSVTLTATPDAGYQFKNWTVAGAEVSTVNPYTFTVNADITVTANFEELPKETVYFINTPKWSNVKAYAYEPANAAWPGVDATKETEKIGEFDVYSYTAIAGQYANVIFNGKLNGGDQQTADLVWTAGKYYIHEYNGTTGWVTKEEAEAKLAAPVVKTYTVVGSSAPLFGAAWSTTETANDMTLVEGTKYELVKNDITLAIGEIQYKVAVNHAWTEAYPNDNEILSITEAGKYKVTFTFNSDSKEVGATAELIEAAVVLPTVGVKGAWDGWATTTTLTGDNTSASATVNIATAGIYEFGLDVDGNFQASGATIDKANNSTVVTGNNGNMKLTANVLGDYTFTWTYETKTLVVTYPAGEEVEITKKYYIAGTQNLTGFDWKENGLEIAKEGDVYKHTFSELGAGIYEFKITDGTWTNPWGYSNLGAVYEEVSEGTDGDGNPNGNIKFGIEEAKNITVIFNHTTGKITFEGLTPVTTTLTYKVKVPAGTDECYIAGPCNSWDFRKMTREGTTDVFTIEIVGAKETDEYKYACKANWDYAEVREADENGNSNRKTWTALDEVTAWNKPVVYTYYLMGVNDDWATGIEMVVNSGNGSEVMLTCQPVNAKVKIKRVGDDGSEYWYGGNSLKTADGSLGTNTSTDGGDGNIALATGIYNFYFNTTDGKLWIGAATNCVFELGDGDNSNVLVNGVTVDLKVTRSFASGTLYTLVLPFAMNNTTVTGIFGDDVELYDFTSLSENTSGELILSFTKQATPAIVAGTPYLIKPETDANGFDLTSVTINTATTPVAQTYGTTTITMQPVLSAAAEDKTNGESQYWLAADNNLYNNIVSIKGLRVIFDVQTTMANVRARAAFNENVETGVEDLFTTDTPVKVIENGQLIIIRDGVKYNVQGQKL